ncbi:serine hydrolase domain-containing protein [Corynebacterium anserum]|uniref:Serine hydrolase n=1 Tax=Corynebacterium anserum TaxID=2684406 RepID=A0A7G7YMR7_9CORY|nr:serine hydrolase domain-containing protein [Corynebacterium anserum]MBC2681163.1 serine hydrolase [Corynebacterium anserum]QNH95787.1 serine hydrolase [Corynebacterium anserum]
MSIVDVLQTTGEWPVEEVAASAITSDGIECVGDTSESFSLASVSKLITAYAVLIAYEEGAFDLDDGVPPSLLPSFDVTPTYRELLSHASGMAFASREQEKPARTRRIYSSAGYEVLAEALEYTTEIAFPDYVNQAVSQPLNIEITVEGSAGHGFSASVDALTTLAQEFLGPRLLSEETLEEALHPQFPRLSGIVPGYGRHNPCTWGLGFSLHGGKIPHWIPQSMPHDTAGHFGQSGTFLWIHRPSNRAAVVLTTRHFGDWAKERWTNFNDQLWQAMGG